MDSPKKFPMIDLTGANNSFWRIDWFGYLSYGSSEGNKKSEPLVDVYLSKLKEHPSKTNFFNKFSSEYSCQRVVPVPVELVSDLRVGDVWKKGVLVHVPKYKYLDISFDPNLSQTIIAGAPKDLEKNEYWISAKEHPYHLKATKVYCENIQINKTDYVIFPHYAILQAYFSKCSYVFRKLFEYGVTKGELYNNEKTDLGDGDPGRIVLKKKVHDVGAWEVARIAWDPVAYRAAASVSEIFSTQKSNGVAVRPKTYFPFSPTTNMKVKGKWCRINDKEKALVVFDILSCTAPFPFESLEYFRDNPGDKNKDSHRFKPEYQPQSQLTKKPKVNEEVDIDIVSEPSNQIESYERIGRPSIDYLDLRGKSIQKRRMDPHKKSGPSRSGGIDIDVPSLAAGDGDSQGISAPISTSSSIEGGEQKEIYLFGSKICRLDLFSRFCAYLSKQKNIQDCRYIPFNLPENIREKFAYFPKAFTDSGREMTWHYINYIKGEVYSGSDKNKLRRCLIIRYLKGGRYYYLMESERRIKDVGDGWREYDHTALLKVKTYQQLSDQDIRSILHSCVSNRGTWKPDPIEGVYFESVRHPDNDSISDETYIEKMWNAVH